MAKRCVWVWWDRDEPEDGLVGFPTVRDRDRFHRNEPGPYRRIVSADGHTVSQTWTWSDMMDDVKRQLGELDDNG